MANPTYVPALRGQMGDWVYYVTTMKLATVAKETQFAADVHRNDELDDLIQREIGKRVEKEMVPYLLNQPQRFYGALIVAVYLGEPEFHPVQIAEHPLVNDTERSKSGFGLLRFDGSQIYFALDGQHRLKSIQLALQKKPDLAKEEVAVIIVKHDNTEEGLARTRRLFSTLNRRAEKTTVGLNIAIDEDDPTAITTRRLVREHPLLGEKKMVKANKEGLGSKQLSPLAKDEAYLTTLQTLYEANEYLLEGFAGGMDVDDKFRANRPETETLDAYYEYLAALWSDILQSSPDMEPILEGRQKPGSLRIDKRAGGGGNALGRPIGQLIIAQLISVALRQGRDQQSFIKHLFRDISFNLDDIPWRKLVWNPENRTIIGGKKERDLIVNLLRDKYDLKCPVRKRELLEAYRSATQDKRMKLLSSARASDEADSEDEQPSLLSNDVADGEDEPPV